MIISDAPEGESNLAFKRMIFSTRKGMGVMVSNYLLEVIRAGQFDTIPDHMFNILMYNEILVPEEEDELKEILTRKKLTASDVDASEMHLHVNSQTIFDGAFTKIINDRITQLSVNRSGQVKSLIVNISGEDGAALNKLLSALDTCLGNLQLPPNTRVQGNISCSNASHLNIDYFSDLKCIWITDLKLSLDVEKDSHAMIDVLNVIQTQLERRTNNEPNVVLCLYVPTHNDAWLSTLQEQLQTVKNLPNTELKIFLSDNGSAPMSSQEKKFLEYLHALNLPLNYIPQPSHTYYTDAEMDFENSIGLAPHLDVESNIRASGSINFPRSAKKGYDDRIVQALTNNMTRCAACIYLPMCGGRLNKSEEHDHDCPDFIRNLMDKVRLKYGMHLS